MKIYVARHGQTQWNLENRTCGRTDIPLTELGLEQAQQLAERTKDLHIDVIIASTMIRARQTAEPVAELHGLEVLTDERLVEQDYGIYDGKSRFDEGFLANKRNFAYRYPGGESMMDLAHRIYGFLDEVRKPYSVELYGFCYMLGKAKCSLMSCAASAALIFSFSRRR